MELAHEDGIGLLRSIGFPAADGMIATKVENKINRLLEVTDDKTEVKDPSFEGTYNAVRKALEAGDKISIVVKDPPAEEKEEKPKKARKNSKEEKSETEVVEETTEQPENMLQKPEKPLPPEKPKKARKVKGRGYYAGLVVKEFGIDEVETEITDEMINRVDTLTGKPNFNESWAWLLKAVQFLAGYEDRWAEEK